VSSTCREHWDAAAAAFDDEIFDVCGCDRGGVVRNRIGRFASKRKTALDLGCGIGRMLPMLSRSFGTVYGVDISRRCLTRAAGLRLGNVELVPADITDPRCRLPRCDVVVSVNSILSTDAGDCRRSFALIRRTLKKGGAAIVVVPSLESCLYKRSRLIERCQQMRMNPRPYLDEHCRLDIPPRRQPVIAIGGVPTRHFLREELWAGLAGQGFRDVAIEKVEYRWADEMVVPPLADRPPFPWDWCAVARA
jgi:SAM-dependent methyltransferase